ncbi:MAG: MFS transporter [Planctomycetes bacterium]|nr:MFS transporter [Planctomycetota bacterium]
MRQGDAPRAGRRVIAGWVLYDVANSAFVTSIVTAIFSVYFAKAVVGDEGVRVFGSTFPADSVWTFTLALAAALGALPAPILGSMADAGGTRKRFLFGFWILGVAATSALYFATPGRWLYAAAVFSLAEVGFSAGNVFYNALLRDVAREDELDRVSSLGYALGYVGGGASLAIGMALIWAGSGAPDPSAYVRADFPFVALWWLGFGVPIFLWVREGRPAAPAGAGHARRAWGRFVQSLRNVLRLPELWKLWLAHLLYNDAVMTAIGVAGVFGSKELGMSQGRLALCFLVLQFINFAGTMAFVRISRRFGELRALLAALAIWAGAIIGASFMTSEIHYWILAGIIGLVLGGTQALSRSLYARLCPAAKTAELFGFYAYSEKISAIAGPLLYGFVAWRAGSRWGIRSLAIPLVAGIAILAFVRVRKGVRDAEIADAAAAAAAATRRRD